MHFSIFRFLPAWAWKLSCRTFAERFAGKAFELNFLCYRVKYALGYKNGMTQVYKDDKAVVVTAIRVPKNVVCLVSGKDNEIKRIDIGIDQKRSPTKAEKGKYASAKIVPKHVWTVDEQADAGSSFGAEVFQEGDILAVTGVTKGKGFAGVVKRWGFHGGPRTHGQSDRQRSPGSIGAGTDPGRVLPGKKMAGRMGGDVFTIQRRVVGIGDDYILVKGP
ncbi:MAG: 50S ribosomal protein L3, partial [Candidatus Dojkabacteria bacterium]|nr:50S ribosomal protein L3 [Candidatus Dojkabacteria bacterium]